MDASRFEGLTVALATPFAADGSLDVPGFRRLARHVRGGGADVLLVLGTTGEAATLDARERDALVVATLEEADGATVLVGAGTNATAESAARTARARELGAHGALVVTPYYVKPTPRGVVAHFRAIADAVPGFPLVAYNVPGRACTNVTPATLAELWAIDEVVAVKESSGDLGQIAAVGRALPATKRLLAGDDGHAVASIAVGASGLVSVLGNVLPAETAALVEAARAARRDEAIERAARLAPVVDALFGESNPIPLKAALAELGLCGDALRLPMTPPEPSTRRRVAEALAPFRAPVGQVVSGGA